MKLRTIIRLTAFALLLGASTSAMTNVAYGQAPSPPTSETAQGWTTEQLITSTVHDAWMLSGKDEAKFFDMVKTLAELSAEKRGISLPDSKQAGMRMGANIKRMAKADTDQLLYAVVDKAVVIAAHAQPIPAGTRVAKDGGTPKQ